MSKLTLFDSRSDYVAFERVLCEAAERFPMRLLCYALMPNHWHLVLWPIGDDDLSRYMQWVTMTHAQRWHLARASTGAGAVYQGRFKAVPVQCDRNFLTLCTYVERNPVEAKLVARAEEWPWSSASAVHPAVGGPPTHPWPVERPADWAERVNRPLPRRSAEAVRRCIRQGVPFGQQTWRVQTALRLGWSSALRPRGRPAKILR